VDIVKKVEETIEGKDCTFTAFVVEAVRAALQSIEDESKLVIRNLLAAYN